MWKVEIENNHTEDCWRYPNYSLGKDDVAKAIEWANRCSELVQMYLNWGDPESMDPSTRIVDLYWIEGNDDSDCGNELPSLDKGRDFPFYHSFECANGQLVKTA